MMSCNDNIFKYNENHFNFHYDTIMTNMAFPILMVELRRKLLKEKGISNYEDDKYWSEKIYDDMYKVIISQINGSSIYYNDDGFHVSFEKDPNEILKIIGFDAEPAPFPGPFSFINKFKQLVFGRIGNQTDRGLKNL